MDKLTWYDSDGRINCRRGYEVALARLASYEATGMMPDEIVKMGMAYEDSKRYSGRLELKLMPYLNIGLSPGELKALMLASTGKCVAEIKAFDGVAIDRLCDLAEADRDGRVVVLPCKVGDTLWVTSRDNVPREMELEAPDIRAVCTDEDNLCMSTCNRKPDGFCAYRLRNDGADIGNTVFLTREEAEKALEAMKGGD
jgi:hypothetical protein